MMLVLPSIICLDVIEGGQEMFQFFKSRRFWKGVIVQVIVTIIIQGSKWAGPHILGFIKN